MIDTRTDLLNALIKKYGYKTYLEIGVQNRANNFDLIRCDVKVGVDPDIQWSNGIFICTSDRFFEEKMKDAQYIGMGAYPVKFDLIFIDGLHHYHQVVRDFENSLKCLSPGGRIVIHDVLPENEQGTAVPRETRVWWGDVYKWAMTIGTYDGIGYKTLNMDNGCLIVWKDDTKKGLFAHENYTWADYLAAGKSRLNAQERPFEDKI
jgi:SAM-dependent methyltransferase